MEYIDIIQKFVKSLDAKDWITLIASISALIFSILSYRQKSNEGKLALRKQLTDLLEKLTELNIEAAKFRLKESEYPGNYSGLLNDKRRFLVRQANFLINSISDLVSPYEYLLVAGAYDEINDTFQAEMYYRRAIDSSIEPIDKGIAVRGYARYLFQQGPTGQDQARIQYNAVVELFSQKNDRHKIYLADSYIRWGNQEREWKNFPAALDLFEKAVSAYSSLSNPGRRNIELAKARDLVQEAENALGRSNEKIAA